MNKQELTEYLKAQTTRAQNIYGVQVTVYAAYPEPEKKHPQRKIPNLREENYQAFLEEIGAKTP